MKYNNQIITKRHLSAFEKNIKIINNLRLRQADRVTTSEEPAPSGLVMEVDGKKSCLGIVVTAS